MYIYKVCYTWRDSTLIADRLVLAKSKGSARGKFLNYMEGLSITIRNIDILINMEDVVK